MRKAKPALSVHCFPPVVVSKVPAIGRGFDHGEHVLVVSPYAIREEREVAALDPLNTHIIQYDGGVPYFLFCFSESVSQDLRVCPPLRQYIVNLHLVRTGY